MNSPTPLAATILVVLSFQSASWATGFVHVLKPGLYRIDVIAEDVPTGRQTTVRQVERCLEPQAIAAHGTFEMLSASPASSCPKYEICAGETRTGFMAQCAPDIPLSAVGMFALEPESFRGRIEVTDGDGNLVDIEIQYGERVGDCSAATTSGPMKR
ncbi:hypothetical protein [Hyphomicrobium sp.]|uniref:hypothetical protein n=1 Tax=Hyphomicrobium sp. TaxID=82 RepID=UPI002FE19AA9